MLETIKDNLVAATAIVASGAVLTIALVKEVIKLHRTNEVVIPKQPKDTFTGCLGFFMTL